MPPLTTAIEDATSRLLTTVRSLDTLAPQSRCEGWTRGHVLAHLARNADALAGVIAGAVEGRPTPMYRSTESRNADIDEGARLPLAELVEDVERSAAVFAREVARLPEDTDATFERTPGGAVVPVALVPAMRLREVVFHHVDLDAGFTFDDVDADLLARFLQDAVGRLDRAGVAVTVRSTEGDELVSAGGGTVVTGTRAGLTLWLARRDPSGVRADGELPELPHGG